MTKEELQQFLLEKIPLTRALEVQVIKCSLDSIKMKAPLAANINHKSTAFGGSLNALLTLSCWAWAKNYLTGKGIESHIVIQKNQGEYLQPVTKDFVAECKKPPEAQLNSFFKVLEKKSKARIELKSRVCHQSQILVKFQGTFVCKTIINPSSNSG